MIEQIIKRRIHQTILLLGPVVTIVINPWTNYDPINPIKVLCLTTLSFLAFGFLITKYKAVSSLLPNSFIYVNTFFIVWLFVSFFLSGAPKTQQLWGMFGRNTGLIMYLSLVLLAFSTSLIQEKTRYQSLLRGFIFVGLFETIYCYMQIARIDPIKWNLIDIFGTLGNANFLSAFLGMTAVATFALALSRKSAILNKPFLITLLIAEIYILKTTNSIQGLMIFFGSSVVLLYLYIHYQIKLKFLRLPYLLLSAVFLVLTSMALFNFGPLRKYVYQETIIFRMDYWHAGWKISTLKPIFGAGIDSYGDWYRQVRGYISATRTDPNRTANTAHNIFLDISSGGGFPLLIAYLIMILISLILSIKYLKRNTNFDPIFVAFFCAWIAYQLQSLISINQVGVGVWGWILNGVLIGYARINSQRELMTEHSNEKSRSSKNSKGSRRTKNRTQVLAPSTSMVGFAFMIIGFLISLPPLSTDMKFRSAMNKGDLNGMISASQSSGATAWHLTQVIEVASKSNYTQQAIQMDLELIRRFPRDFYGWRVAASLNGIPAEIQAKARKKILELDPDNPNLSQFRS